MHAIYESHYLTDNDVANFARQSFAGLAKNFTVEQNNSLIRFLARGMSSQDWEGLITEFLKSTNKEQVTTLAKYIRSIPDHWTPFGHPHISIRMRAPVPIARQAFKHKIGFVESEESRRYIKSIPTVFMPKEIRAAASNAKQGSGGVHPESEYWLKGYVAATTLAIQVYDRMIAAGVCPEQARFVLPQGCEVNWVWTGSLYAYANFYNQRSNSHAQAEIQELASQIEGIISPLFPVSWAALTQGSY